MKNKKSNRGGKRKGAGRKKLAPTKTVSFRVKVEYVEPIKLLVKAEIERLDTAPKEIKPGG